MQPFLVLSGLNNFGVSGSELRGCINDIRNCWEFVKIQQLFAKIALNWKSTGYTLWDAMATAERIRLAIADAINKAQKGDFIWYHHSGHGSFDGDDYYACGYQFNWSRKAETFVSGRQYFALFKKAAEKGIKVLFTNDSCNSGGAVGRDISGPPRDIRFKAVQAPFVFNTGNAFSIEKAIKDEKLGIVYISGCGPKATDYSADVVGSDGRAYGAMTKYLLLGFGKALVSGNKVTYRDCVKRTCIELTANQFEQQPEIHGGEGPLTPDDFIFSE